MGWENVFQSIDNAKGLIGIIIGAISGVWIAYIQRGKKDSEKVFSLKSEVKELHEKYDKLESHTQALKKAFFLVFEHIERTSENPDNIAMLKDFKNAFEL